MQLDVAQRRELRHLYRRLPSIQQYHALCEDPVTHSGWKINQDPDQHASHLTATATMATTVSASKRWTHFHSALQLAIQRSARKWTYVAQLSLHVNCTLKWSVWIRYEDFAECFSLWCEEEPDSSSSVCSTIANHLESSITVCNSIIIHSYPDR